MELFAVSEWSPLLILHGTALFGLSVVKLMLGGMVSFSKARMALTTAINYNLARGTLRLRVTLVKGRQLDLSEIYFIGYKGT